jgi:hypothetical protein
MCGYLPIKIAVSTPNCCDITDGGWLLVVINISCHTNSEKHQALRNPNEQTFNRVDRGGDLSSGEHGHGQVMPKVTAEPTADA